MTRYLLRRLLIAVPSLLGISLVLYTVLALAPGDPFGELATNPNVPPEVGAVLRAKFGLDDPIALRYLHWLTAMLQGDWGFSFVSRVNVDQLILQRLPVTLLVIGSSKFGRRIRHQPPALTFRDTSCAGPRYCCPSRSAQHEDCSRPPPRLVGPPRG